MTSSALLTRVCLGFKDRDLADIFQQERTDFYAKAMPVTTSVMLLHSGALALASRAFGIGGGATKAGGGLLPVVEHPWLIETVNGGFFVFFLLVTGLHSKCNFLQSLVAPALTLLQFYYMCFVDYDKTLASIYFA